MSTLKEKNEAWKKMDTLIYNYVSDHVSIQQLRDFLITAKAESYEDVLDLAEEGADKNFYVLFEQLSNTIDGYLIPEYFMFNSWAMNHKDLVEIKDSKDGLYEEVYYKADGSLMFRFEKIDKKDK